MSFLMASSIDHRAEIKIYIEGSSIISHLGCAAHDMLLLLL